MHERRPNDRKPTDWILLKRGPNLNMQLSKEVHASKERTEICFNTNSESSVNFKHARKNNMDDRRHCGSTSTTPRAHIDFDPYIIPDSSGTQEQSGHTPPDYHPRRHVGPSDIPSPAREESEEVDTLGESTFDPAELEWLIFNAIGHTGQDTPGPEHNDGQIMHNDFIVENTDDCVATEGKGVLEDTAASEENVVIGENVVTAEASVVMADEAIYEGSEVDAAMGGTPTKTPTNEVRRSARIINRSGPVETVQRCTLVAKKKGLEIQEGTGSRRNGIDAEERNGPLTEEDWDRVAEGAGYIISPGKKETVGVFIKGTTRLAA